MIRWYVMNCWRYECFCFYIVTPPPPFCVWVGGLHNKPCVSVSVCVCVTLCIIYKEIGKSLWYIYWPLDITQQTQVDKGDRINTKWQSSLMNGPHSWSMKRRRRTSQCRRSKQGRKKKGAMLIWPPPIPPVFFAGSGSILNSNWHVWQWKEEEEAMCWIYIRDFKSYFQWDFLACCTRLVRVHLAMACVGCLFDSFSIFLLSLKQQQNLMKIMFSCIHFPIWPYPPKIMKKKEEVFFTSKLYGLTSMNIHQNTVILTF